MESVWIVYDDGGAVIQVCSSATIAYSYIQSQIREIADDKDDEQRLLDDLYFSWKGMIAAGGTTFKCLDYFGAFRSEVNEGNDIPRESFSSTENRYGSRTTTLRRGARKLLPLANITSSSTLLRLVPKKAKRDGSSTNAAGQRYKGVPVVRRSSQNREGGTSKTN